MKVSRIQEKLLAFLFLLSSICITQKNIYGQDTIDINSPWLISTIQSCDTSNLEIINGGHFHYYDFVGTMLPITTGQTIYGLSCVKTLVGEGTILLIKYIKYFVRSCRVIRI